MARWPATMNEDQIRKVRNAQANLAKAMEWIQEARASQHSGHVASGSLREAEQHTKVGFKELDELFGRCDDCRGVEPIADLKVVGAKALCAGCFESATIDLNRTSGPSASMAARQNAQRKQWGES